MSDLFELYKNTLIQFLSTSFWEVAMRTIHLFLLGLLLSYSSLGFTHGYGGGGRGYVGHGYVGPGYYDHGARWYGQTGGVVEYPGTALDYDDEGYDGSYPYYYDQGYSVGYGPYHSYRYYYHR